MALDPRMILSGRQTPGSVDVLGNLSRGMAVGSQIQGAQRANQARMAQQQKSEQLSDIFARNVQIDPATGVQGLNKPQALAELYQIDPAMGLKFEKQWVGPGKSIGELALKERKLEFEGTKLTSKEKLFGDRLAFDEKKLKAEMDRLVSGKLTPEQSLATEGKLRGEFIKANKDYTTMSKAFDKIQASKGAGLAGSGPSDMALIFNYMKVLDPNSTVREGEFATAEQAGGIGEKVRGYYNKMLKGVRLTPEVRKQFYAHTDRLMNSSTKDYQRSQNTYNKLAKSYGVDPLRVSIGLGLGGQTFAPSAPSKGKTAKKVKRAKSDKSLLTEYDF